jgi:hypothetical protein
MTALYGVPERGMSVAIKGIDITPFLDRRLYTIKTALPRSFMNIHRLVLLIMFEFCLTG